VEFGQAHGVPLQFAQARVGVLVARIDRHKGVHIRAQRPRLVVQRVVGGQDALQNACREVRIQRRFGAVNLRFVKQPFQFVQRTHETAQVALEFGRIEPWIDDAHIPAG
jgi:hypothetical protein